MGLGVSIFLIAVGAILAFAVTADVSGLDVNTIGWILMIVGIIGGALSLIFWTSWGGPAYFGGRRRATFIEEGPPPPGY